MKVTTSKKNLAHSVVISPVVRRLFYIFGVVNVCGTIELKNENDDPSNTEQTVIQTCQFLIGPHI